MKEEEIVKKLIEGLSNKIDEIIIEGLRLKGYTFKNFIDLSNFISNNCKCIDNVPLQQKTFYVNDIPFLLHNYEVKINPMVKDLNQISLSAEYGTYAYL